MTVATFLLAGATFAGPTHAPAPRPARVDYATLITPPRRSDYDALSGRRAVIANDRPAFESPADPPAIAARASARSRRLAVVLPTTATSSAAVGACYAEAPTTYSAPAVACYAEAPTTYSAPAVACYSGAASACYSSSTRVITSTPTYRVAPGVVSAPILTAAPAASPWAASYAGPAMDCSSGVCVPAGSGRVGLFSRLFRRW